MVTTRDHEAIEATCRDKLGLNEEQTEIAIREASGRIAEAAIWNRDIEIGKALVRSNDIYERAMRVQDNKTALAADIHRCKLLGLFERLEKKDETEIEESDRFDAIRKHLEPLGLAPEGAPVEELVRLAVIKIAEFE